MKKQTAERMKIYQMLCYLFQENAAYIFYGSLYHYGIAIHSN